MPAHSHGSAHGHEHSHASDATPRLGLALALTLAFALVEALAGWWSGSLALLSDAGHMLTDSSALGLAVMAAWIARRPPDHRHSWGRGRAEALAALGNSLLMMALTGAIVFGALQRLRTPAAVDGGIVLGVALAGLVLNLAILRALSQGHHHSLNTRAATLHVMADALGSAAAVASGAVILWTGWTPIDPILSLAICALIVVSAARILRDSLNAVMEGVPAHLDLARVGRAMAGAANVRSVHDLHIWQVPAGQIALSAHVVVRSMDDWEATLGRLKAGLLKDYGIGHVTLQPELLPEVRLPHPTRAARP